MSTNQAIRAACYCRISSDPKDKREGVDRQRQDTADLCTLKGWAIAGVYIDNDASATNGDKRPQWTRLLADIKAGKIDAVACWDQDRINRTMTDLMHYKPLFVERGILLATSNNGDIDLSTPAGVLTATIKTAVSTHEVEMMKLRQRRAHRQRAERGKPKWRSAFGYLPYTGTKEDDTGKREPDPVTGKLVADAYRMILTGESLWDICKMFNGDGHHGVKGRPWTRSTVSLFLRDPRNAGLKSLGGKLITGEDGSDVALWTPLVDPKTWHAVQAKLGQPSRKPGRKTKRRHLLTGVLNCGVEGCGGTLSGYKTGNGAGAYRCKNGFHLAVRADDVEPFVVRMVGERLAMADAVDLLKASHDEETSAAIRAKLIVLYARSEEIAVSVGTGDLTPAQARIATAVVQTEIDQLERAEQDDERLAVLADIPLGTQQAIAAVAGLSDDRLRAVIDVIAAPVVAAVGKGQHNFRQERIDMGWKQ
jgi:DNA invertase Pin-like site-specific DNA recombinase